MGTYGNHRKPLETNRGNRPITCRGRLTVGMRLQKRRNKLAMAMERPSDGEAQMGKRLPRPVARPDWPEGFSVRLPHQRLSDLRGRMPRATSRCAFFPLVNHVSFLCPLWLLINIGGAYME